MQKFYFSASGDPQETIDAWTGGASYQHLFAIKLIGFKVEFWKHITNQPRRWWQVWKGWK